jgi:4a-hydroxytetrahydrobiopterin dehydratase
MTKLTDAEISQALASLPGWRREGDELVRTFDRGTFLEAVGFVNRIAPLAEKADHHPDLDLRYSKVTVRLTTHDAGGLTRRDVALAQEIMGIA